MALDLVIITELDAVNAMLEMTGAAPVASLPSSGVSEAYIARNILHRKSREIQGKGLSFNTDEKYEMATDENGYIMVPSNVLRMDPHYNSDSYVIRYDTNDSKLKLYNRTEHTFVFTAAVSMDVVWFFEWAGLPDHARNYIYVMAAREFEKKFQTSENIYKLTQEDEVRASGEFWSAEYRQDDDSILQSPGVFYTVNRRV